MPGIHARRQDQRRGWPEQVRPSRRDELCWCASGDQPHGPRRPPALPHGPAAAPERRALPRRAAEAAQAHRARHLLERRDPVLGRRMGREQVVHAVAGERIDDEQVRGRRACARRVGFSICCAAPEILASAEASASGRPQMRAPSSSAAYSRVRLIAICTSMAAIGARITIAMVPITPSAVVVVAMRRRRTARTAPASRSRPRSSR